MRLALICLILLLAGSCLSACAPPLTEEELVDRGRYLIKISGCNDCHTEDFMLRGGQIPEQEWLMGSRLGWHNEEGTTYATNLRLLLNELSEREWVKKARTMRTKSPMAWYRIVEINDDDLRAIYRYIRALGPAGEPAPKSLPAGVTPPDPYLFFPKAH
jgi:mono/diheme cytochrome c family protein